MKNKIFKMIWSISVIIEIIVFIMRDFVYKDEILDSTNYLLLIIIEIINIIFGILLFKKRENKLIYILYIVFVVITLFIPIYNIGTTYAPTGPGRELMGLCVEYRDVNIYDIDIIKIIK